MRRSQASATSSPPPRHQPRSRAITGTGTVATASHRPASRVMKTRALAGSSAAISAMSAPPMKARSPLPRSTSTRSRRLGAPALPARRCRSAIAAEPTMFSRPASVSASLPMPPSSSSHAHGGTHERCAWSCPQAVPPTVSLSMRKVGWPTPTGTLWPSLPQLPTPVSSSMSLPIIADPGQRVRAVADQRRTLDRVLDLAVLDPEGLAGRKDELAAGDVDLAAAEIGCIDAALEPATISSAVLLPPSM